MCLASSLLHSALRSPPEFPQTSAGRVKTVQKYTATPSIVMNIKGAGLALHLVHNGLWRG